MKWLILFVSVFTIPKFSLAQDYNYHSYTIKSGLPSNLVYAIKQDKKGYIWATTDKGVVKYDGNKFKILTVKDGLASNDNFVMLIDSKDNIWLYSFKAISKIEPSGKVKIFGNTKSYYRTFLINDKDQLFYSVLDSVSTITNQRFYSSYIIDMDVIKNINIEPVEHKQTSIKRNYLSSYFYYFENKLKFISYDDANLDKFIFSELNENKLELDVQKNIPHDFIPLNCLSSQIDDHIKLNDSIIGLFSENCFRLKVNGVLKDQKLYPHNQNRITSGNNHIFDKYMFIVFDKSIYTYDFIHDKFYLFSDMSKCSGIIKDYEGNIWISTLDNGIIRFDNFTIKSGIFDNKFESKQKIQLLNGYKDKSVWCFSSKNELFDLRSNKKYLTPELIDRRLLEVDGNDIYYGGSNILYRNNSKILKLGFKGISLHNDSFAYTTSFGINFINKNPNSISQFDHGWKKYDINGRMNAVLMLNKIFYSGNQNGLFWGFQNKDELFPIRLDDDIESISVNGIKKSSDGLIWVATEGRGVYLLKDKVPIRHFLTELLDGNIHSMKIDEKNQVWLSTRNGINKISLSNGKYVCSKYTSFHGLPSDYVFDTYCYGDKLYVATDEGLVKLDLKQVDAINISLPPPIYITEVMCKGKDVNLTLRTDSTYQLKYYQNSLSLSFTGISYKSNGNISYKYRLLPAFRDWRFTTNQSIEFDQLDPGSYQFEVIAINALGVESNKPAIYNFKINKQLIHEYWFLTLIGLLLTTTLVLIIQQIIKYRKKRILEKSNTEQLISELRLKSLQAQLNPHFIFNSLNAIQQFINTEDKKSANDYLSRFARLMRLYLNGSDSQFISLAQELDVLKLYCSLEHLRFFNKFQYKITIDNAINLEDYFVPAMLLQPHVENAIRHGLVSDNRQNKLLSINVYKSVDDVICEILDNGIGRKKAIELKKNSQFNHRSMGNKISKDRLEMIRSLNLAYISESIIDLMDDNGNASGTKVVITISKTKQTQ